MDLNYSLTLPVDSLDFTTIDNQYLLNGSSLTYHINLTLSPPAAYYCYGIAQARGEEVIKIVEICNTTAAEFTVSSELESYFQVIVSLLNSENDLKIQAISVRANGTVFYYDISSLHDRFVCQLHPRVQTSCTIPINSVSEAGYHKNNLCILARREGLIDEKDDPMSPFFEYNIASFSYGQVILVIFICVGLVSFVCMLGLSVSCCTKQGRRLRVILHMSSPLVN